MTMCHAERGVHFELWRFYVEACASSIRLWIYKPCILEFHFFIMKWFNSMVSTAIISFQPHDRQRESLLISIHGFYSLHAPHSHYIINASAIIRSYLEKWTASTHFCRKRQPPVQQWRQRSWEMCPITIDRLSVEAASIFVTLHQFSWESQKAFLFFSLARRYPLSKKRLSSWIHSSASLNNHIDHQVSHRSLTIDAKPHSRLRNSSPCSLKLVYQHPLI